MFKMCFLLTETSEGYLQYYHSLPKMGLNHLPHLLKNDSR